MKTRLLIAAVAWVALPALAWSETFVLTGGGKLEGTLVNPQESPREKYIIKTTTGGQITLTRDQVKEVVRQRPEEVEYEKVRHTYPDTVAGQWALATWCRDHNLVEARKTHLKRVIELDPDHAEARGALGYGRFDGEWKTQQEVQTERGYVQYKGRWRLPQEVEILEEQRKIELAEKAWFGNIKRWRDWLNGPKSAEAEKAIGEIRDPLAVPAIKKQIELDQEQSIRLLFVEALANIDSGSAITTLAGLSIEDPDQEIRMTALDHLDDTPRPDVINFYIGKLHDKDNNIVNRAATGLARMKDPAAIPPLVDALVTQHKFKLVTGSGGGGGNQYSTTFGPGGSGLGVGGGGPKIITQELRNPAVLEALVLLSGNVNFNYDIPAWKTWLAGQRKSKAFDARRG